jgi:hypothetical protein
MPQAAETLPEQRQLVSARSRQWVVHDVRPSALLYPPLQPAFSGAQHLVALSSVEDDGLGEELQVIWEIEPGADVAAHQQHRLPQAGAAAAAVPGNPSDA